MRDLHALTGPELFGIALAAFRFPRLPDLPSKATAREILGIAQRFPQAAASILPWLATELRRRQAEGPETRLLSASLRALGPMEAEDIAAVEQMRQRAGIDPAFAALAIATLPALAALPRTRLPWIAELDGAGAAQQALSPLFRLLLFATLARRADVRANFAATPGGDIDWFMVLGLSEHRLWHLLPQADLDRLLTGTGRQAPLFLRSVLRFRPDLKALAEAGTPEASDALRGWVQHHLRAEYPLPLDPPAAEARARGRITVIGPARYVLGIADDCFSICRALEELGCDYEVLDTRPSPWIEVDADKHRFLRPRLVKAPTGDRALFGGPLFEGTLWALRHWAQFQGFARAEIYAPWELARLPPGWEAATRLFDTILTPSRFVREAFAATGSTPAVHVAPSIELVPQHRAASALILRRRLRLPARTRIVASVFDFSSYLERKNPGAAIAAFRRSARQAPRAVLVVKTTRARRARAAQARLLRDLRGAGVELRWVDGAWPNAAIEALLRNAAAYISLHRSEGFGRNIGKALMLGTPVVVTDWSGSTDMRDMAGYAGVPHRPRRLGRGDYVCGEGQCWAEPEIRAAAAALIRALTRPRLGRPAGDVERFSRGKFAARLAAALWPG